MKTNKQERKLAGLRLEVIKLALSERTSKHALIRMRDAGIEGRREASEIGRKKAQSR